MKRFKVFIINGKKIKRAASAALAIASSVGICAAVSYNAPKAITAFSVAGGDISETILKSGMPHEDEPFDIKEIMNTVLGFDKDEPTTIIESAYGTVPVHEDATPPPTPEAVITPPQSAESSDSALPSHNEIISAPGPEINNATSYNIDTDSLCRQPSDIKISLSDEPEVLVFHTHTTECYDGDEMSGESERTTNENYNVCAVGDVICDTLESYGIHTIHDKTIHDYPSYQGSYTRALSTLTADLEKYPSIKVTLDIHRDAYVYSDGSKLRVATNINGKDTAQVMLVLGTDSMGLYHPHWRSNLVLAAKIQSAAQIMYPDMMRPINLRRERFNMHATKGSLLIEVGSNGNSLAEARSSAEYIGRAIAAALLEG